MTFYGDCHMHTIRVLKWIYFYMFLLNERKLINFKCLTLCKFYINVIKYSLIIMKVNLTLIAWSKYLFFSKKQIPIFCSVQSSYTGKISVIPFFGLFLMSYRDQIGEIHGTALKSTIDVQNQWNKRFMSAVNVYHISKNCAFCFFEEEKSMNFWSSVWWPTELMP